MVFAAVDDASLRTSLEAKGEQDDGLVADIRADEEGLEMLAKDFYVERTISREEFSAARIALTSRLEANQVKLARRTSSGTVGRFVGHGELLREKWQGANLEWRRSIVGALLEKVEIQPGKPGRLPFDPQRVRPVWRY